MADTVGDFLLAVMADTRDFGPFITAAVWFVNLDCDLSNDLGVVRGYYYIGTTERASKVIAKAVIATLHALAAKTVRDLARLHAGLSPISSAMRTPSVD